MSEQPEFDTEALLLRMRELVETARPMPLSASVLISRDEFADLLDDALHGLPEELRRARWLLKEREEFLAQARRDAEDLVEAARTRAEHMVERTEVVREANRVAQGRVDDAEARARALRHEAEDYIDQKLAGFEVVLTRTMQAVQHGRERLSVHIEPEDGDEAETEDEETAGFFDQDEM
ncbi:MAG: ATPase [Acidimicrobiia bacterium]|nr:ATPase [Acidimicrobiia bacterium]